MRHNNFPRNKVSRVNEYVKLTLSLQFQIKIKKQLFGVRNKGLFPACLYNHASGLSE